MSDDQGNAEPVVPTDAVEPDAPGEQFYRHADTGELYVTGTDPNGEHYDVPAQMVSLDAYNAVAAELADAQDRIAELESAPADDGGSFLGVRTPALDAFQENQFQGEVQAWERETGLSYDDTEPAPETEA